MLRDADDLLEAAVRESVSVLDTADADVAVVRLAIEYARTIDGCHDREWGMRWIAPLLLDCLEQLGCTPASRARIKTGKPGDAPVGQLAKIRAARRT